MPILIDFGFRFLRGLDAKVSTQSGGPQCVNSN